MPMLIASISIDANVDFRYDLHDFFKVYRLRVNPLIIYTAGSYIAH